MSHVGDSRAILVSKVNNNVIVKRLTNDHKPKNIEEKKRIEASGGEVKKLIGDIPHRVFKRGEVYPGLAMSRALGDAIA
jgi:serine/threonine protein phosphatase PrpC